MSAPDAPAPRAPGGSQIGVMLPMSDPTDLGNVDVASAARHLEEIGADAVWAGDHLAFHCPVVESTVALATAAAVTDRVRLGFGILLLALRQPAWVAKQIASLQAVSADRIVLGIGVGGENPAEWAAAGVPVCERGRRTDAILDALPDLLSGRATTIGSPYDLSVPALTPHGAVPPIWVGGRSEAALLRAASYGQGWLGMWADERRLARAREQLDAFAARAGRPPVRIGLLVFVHIAERESARPEVAGFVEGQYRMPYEKVERYTVIGSGQQVARQLRDLLDAGVDELLLFPAARDHHRQYDELADVIAALR